MAEIKRYGLGNQLDIAQILLEAKHRWLRPAEICEILRNFQKFDISSEPANMPPGGSLFLFDRKVLRYFRKDGHNWRKKKDGKTVREAHERLKAGSVDVLHCYYAHGEENENFQRRSYWMLEEDLQHIVLVHYREVKGNRTNYNHFKGTEEAVPYSHETEEIAINSEMDNSVSSSFNPNNFQMHSQAAGTTSLSSAQASEFEDAESAYNHQASSQLQPFLELLQPKAEKINAGFSNAFYPMSFSKYQEKLSAVPGVNFSSHTQAYRKEDGNDAGVTYDPRKNPNSTVWDGALGNITTGLQSLPFQPSISATHSDSMGIISQQENETLGHLFTDNFGKKQMYEDKPRVQQSWQTLEANSSGSSSWPVDQNLHSDTAYDVTTRFHGGVDDSNLLNSPVCRVDSEKTNNFSMPNDLQIQPSNTEQEYHLKSISKRNETIEGKYNHTFATKPLLDEGLKKLDSFNRWMSKELGDVDETHTQSNSETYWDTVESDNGVDESSIPLQVRLDSYMLGPSLSQVQLFSIIDFSPNWAYENSVIKVLITGRFLKSQQAESCKWSCMFGEVEVPAEVIADGVLRCYSPIHKAGRIPFYVTCSNRLACSEIREFEYRVGQIPDYDVKDDYSGCTNEILNMHFGKLLSLSSSSPTFDPTSVAENSEIISKIDLLLKNDNGEWDKMLQLTSDEDFSLERVEDQLLQQLLKEKLLAWLLQKLAAGGKGPSVLDEGGQGVLHFGAALGYDWVLLPTITAGVSVNFRDINGWTALHWAAFCGRERTVASLISLGAAPGLLTDPKTKYPNGRTPADLASAQGHKGIAGYLAESALSDQLSFLNLDIKEDNNADISGANAVRTVSEQIATPIGNGDLTDGLSLRDSLTAVCNATQAAARIHQVFRVKSFQLKQLKEYGSDNFGISDEDALSMIAVKSHKPGKRDEHVDAAAIRIQNKFRSWKGRKDYLIIRQRIVKIQAHVRGHQVRKNYRKIVWSVGIVEKIILRWRRKGSGLRGFKPEPLTEAPSMQASSSKDDDYDVLKEGRKQTEQRLQKALARVKSMVQYPEARDQYCRLLNVVTEIQETKVVYDSGTTSSEGRVDMDHNLIDIAALLDEEDIYMPTEAPE
ncbi:calmodulin-binding transcription activator 3-like isoform X2 [Malus sylvestris]|uniref:calmodulin-binding transcription activator 3-like isoform X2 n=1 Tax=Malus sylvestris TaxID=3752 RepID=UPI0021ABC9AB|nr:calmodulin-binding transcription activator 3-like isoform X2 [Malus sylvestris]